MANYTKFQKVIKDAEAKVNADAEKVRAELAEVEAALPALLERAQDIADGMSAADEIKSKWKRGIDVPAIDYLTAQAEDEKCVYMSKAMKARGDALRRALPSHGTLLADHIAPAYAGVLPGVEVIVTNAPLNLWKGSIPEGSMAVVLCQTDAETSPFNGEISGTVTAYYIRSALHRPINVASLEAAARAKRIALEVRSNNVADESGWVTVAGTESGKQPDANAMVIDVLNVSVAGVLDGLPVIAKVGGGSPIKDWVLRVFSGFQTPGVITTARVSVDPNVTKGFSIRYGSSVARATEASSAEQIDGNERTLTIRQVVNLTNVDPASFVSVLTEVSEGYLNGSYVGNGVLTDVRFEATEGALAGNAPVEIVLTYKSLVA
jgi:hypothetical protein